jgi:dihydroneopterin aldolase
MKVELRGLHVFGYHGVGEDEQRLGQLFLFDVELEVADERGSNDRLADAIDYEAVASAVRELSNAQRFDLLEALATRTADLLYERFHPDRVRVRVRKPQVKPAGMTVEYSAVSVERP